MGENIYKYSPEFKKSVAGYMVKVLTQSVSAIFHT
jgi:hypothetical protein